MSQWDIELRPARPADVDVARPHQPVAGGSDVALMFRRIQDVLAEMTYSIERIAGRLAAIETALEDPARLEGLPATRRLRTPRATRASSDAPADNAAAHSPSGAPGSRGDAN